jgi:hypothetical protein
MLALALLMSVLGAALVNEVPELLSRRRRHLRDLRLGGRRIRAGAQVAEI